MFKSQFSTRDKSALDECTAAPIFLFQRRQWIYTGVPDGYEYIFDHGVVQLDDDDKPVRDEHGEYKVMTDDELSEMIHGEFDLPCAIETWETERVFLTRQEAEEYGNSRSYNYRKGWRVYAVPCAGELAKALRDGSEFDAKRVDNPVI